MPPMPSDPLWPIAAFAAGGVMLGALLLRLLTRQDHRTWVMARAPSLPIHTLAAGDDAWVRGVVRCAQPLVCPWFDAACVSYHYSREREHTWTTTDKDGKTETHSEWRTEHSEARSTDFEIDDGARIVVRSRGADNEALRGLATDYETGTLRHSASVLELDAVISVLAVKQDDGTFAAENEVPCLLTRQTRDERVRGSARSETALFFFAGSFAFAGGAGAATWWLKHGRAFAPSGLEWLWLLPAGLATWLPIWWLGTFNRLVRLRQQVSAAFRQVDVDLAVRAALVPNLVEVVKAHASHERSLLERLAAIRTSNDPRSATTLDAPASSAARDVLLLHEDYPELHADLLYRDLHERLWAVEEKLAHTRQLYNDIATEWNDRVAVFPASVVASLMGCRAAPLFAGDDAPLPPRLTD